MRIHILLEHQQAAMIDLLAEIHAYYHDNAQIDRSLVRDHLVHHLLAPDSPHQLVVASDDHGTVLGLAAITLVYSLVDFAIDQRKQCQLKELYVRAAHRGQGIGSALMAWVAHYAREQGCHRIDWPVQAANSQGIAFYKKLGAIHIAERMSFRLDKPALTALSNRVCE